MLTTLTHLRKSFINNILIKVFSFFIGYGIWLLLAQSCTTSTWLTIPLCFYGSQQPIDAPATVAVHLAGKRHHLATIDSTSLAAHINTDDLRNGPNQITITNAHLFLPNTINVVHCKPSHIVVTIAQQQTSVPLPS